MKPGIKRVEGKSTDTDDATKRKECRQRFKDQKALDLHWKFIHDPNRHQEDCDDVDDPKVSDDSQTLLGNDVVDETMVSTQSNVPHDDVQQAQPSDDLQKFV